MNIVELLTVALSASIGSTLALVMLSSGRGVLPAWFVGWPLIVALGVVAADGHGLLHNIFGSFFTLVTLLLAVATLVSRMKQRASSTPVLVALITLAFSQPLVTAILTWITPVPAIVALWPLMVSLPLLAVHIRCTHRAQHRWALPLGGAIAVLPLAAAASEATMVGATAVAMVVLAVLTVITMRDAAHKGPWFVLVMASAALLAAGGVAGLTMPWWAAAPATTLSLLVALSVAVAALGWVQYDRARIRFEAESCDSKPVGTA